MAAEPAMFQFWSDEWRDRFALVLPPAGAFRLGAPVTPLVGGAIPLAPYPSSLPGSGSCPRPLTWTTV